MLKDKDFNKMIADLVKQEEKKLGVNSPEFQKKHKEIMDLIEKAGGKDGR